MKPVEFKTRCWNCGKENNRIAMVNHEERLPEDGNVNICIECGQLAIFDKTCPDGARKPSPSEMDELKSDEDIFRALITLERAKQRLTPT